MVSKALIYSNILKDYLVLTKPGIVLLVLITTLTGCLLYTSDAADE